MALEPLLRGTVVILDDVTAWRETESRSGVPLAESGAPAPAPAVAPAITTTTTAAADAPEKPATPMAMAMSMATPMATPMPTPMAPAPPAIVSAEHAEATEVAQRALARCAARSKIHIMRQAKARTWLKFKVTF